MSITGEFGRSAKQWSEKLLKEKLVHIIASDSHSINGRPPILFRALNVASSIAGKDEAYTMVHGIPLKVIKGGELRSIKNV
jgi:protein-tyrosine phosphatase